MFCLKQYYRSPLWACLLVLCLIAACTNDSLLPERIEPAAGIGAAEDHALLPYIVHPGDTIRLTVFGEPDLSGKFKVDGMGIVSIPLIGSLDVKGRTTQDVEELLRASFREGYLKDPKLAVEMAEYRPVYILGEVASPDGYAYSEGMTIANAVALAGGFTYRADRRAYELLRQEANGYQKLEFQIDGPLRPGDIIYVRERIL